MESSQVVIVEKPFDIEGADNPFGKRWGQDVITLTERQIEALRAGKQLALDVHSEYVIFLGRKA